MRNAASIGLATTHFTSASTGSRTRFTRVDILDRPPHPQFIHYLQHPQAIQYPIRFPVIHLVLVAHLMYHTVSHVTSEGTEGGNVWLSGAKMFGSSGFLNGGGSAGVIDLGQPQTRKDKAIFDPGSSLQPRPFHTTNLVNAHRSGPYTATVAWVRLAYNLHAQRTRETYHSSDILQTLQFHY